MHKKYDFKIIEKDRYKNWLNIHKKYLDISLQTNIKKKSFTVMLPPPNVTGKLHLGHAWNNILQDIIVRQKQMLGFNVLFIPGMDHAGIATQNKIKKKLKSQGLLNDNLSKENFLKYAWQWKDKYAQEIRKQWQSLGLILNYEYEKFTLDKDNSFLVKNIFIDFYNKKLIYRDEKIINWDYETKTALSNIEVEQKEEKSFMFYLKYFLEDNDNFFLEVATTRPETIFADQALAVHPKDLRYQKFVGLKVIIPGTNISIPVISDDYVKPDFGSGIVKITPAHDDNDFIIGKKHNLKSVLCINIDGTMNEKAFQYQGLERIDCRQKLIYDLKLKGLLSKKEPYNIINGYSTISGSLVEPRLSLQWFLKTKKISQEVLLHSNINFYPLRYQKNFVRWLENLQDWCISRQLWWGHEIPVWYKDSEIKVQIESPGPGWIPDNDVLDTWFSSSLWPLSTLEWKKDSFLFKNYFPIDVVVTGYDILSFWVSRMCLQSLYWTKKDPFKNVLLHGLIRDNQGQKMSKSKDNGVDPILIIQKYGIDALRWFLSSNSKPGTDLSYHEEQLVASWNFLNKIWNISRFIKLKLSIDKDDFNENELLLPEKYILTKFHHLLTKADLLFAKYEFNELCQLIYQFVWEEFANWTLEFLKDNLHYDNTQKLLNYIFKNILKLLYPFVPFLADFIYSELYLKKNMNDKKSILLSQWPMIAYNSDDCLEYFDTLKSLIIKMRHFFKEYNIKNDILLSLELEISLEKQNELFPLRNSLKKFLQAKELLFSAKVNDNKKVLLFVEKDINVYLDKNTFNNLSYYKINHNLQQQKKFLLKEIERSKNILNNQNFLKKANPHKVNEERKKYADYLLKYKKLIIFEKKSKK